jgi:nucleolar protein 56
MSEFMHTSCLGVFVFDEAGKLIRQHPFSIKEALRYEEELSQGKWIQPELELIKGEMVFLGVKKEKRPGVKLSQDTRKLELISKVIVSEKLKETSSAISADKFSRSFFEDTIIIHVLRTYDELERVLNALVMRVRDFTKLYAPSASDTAASLADVLHILENPGKPEALTFEIKPGHIGVFVQFSHKLQELEKQKGMLEEHLKLTMKRVCPNVLGVAGALIGARLLSLAGSLQQLAMMPYSKLQLLGAEKAMFRHVRKGSKSPKHGIIVTHELVATAKSRGQAARLLAEKLSIAARIDYFKGQDMSAKLVEDIKRKLR